MLALSQGHNDWYRIRNQGTGPAQLNIYDEIGFMGVTAADLISDLADITGPLDVHLNSPGGEVNDGLSIYNCLLARDDVTIYIDGIAASIASVIAMAGDTIRIAPTAQIMVHNPFSAMIGDADDMRAMADRLDENKENIARIYAGRTGMPPEHWMKVMTTEGWYRGQEAVDAKLADELVSVRSKGPTSSSGANAFDLSIYSKGPQNAARHPYHGHFDMMHEPITGVHSHNHACFGCDDGDDGIHAHPHYHDGDATHEHEHYTHTHAHTSDGLHDHAHEAGMGGEYGQGHEHHHVHHVGHMYEPIEHNVHDVTGGHGDDDTSYSTDVDHDAFAPRHVGMDHLPGEILALLTIWDAKYSAEDRRRMASSGQALPDGSYPIADEEDLSNAIHAVGRGSNNSHSTIRRHIIKRAHAMGKSAMIPEAWTSSGSSPGASDHKHDHIYSDADAAALVLALKG